MLAYAERSLKGKGTQAMTTNVINFEVFQKAKANAKASQTVERATGLYTLAYEVSQTNAYAAASQVELEAFAEQNILVMPEKHYDDVIRACAALGEAMRLLSIAADSLERAGQGQEIAAIPFPEMFNIGPYELPDLPA
ncbi:hypothetical protein [Agrobacterium tumefaciens]|uniref:hypothetical protein n=1 Tax=Agrobacterium tumefaciens TaxID=358 RepID=UPI0015742D46|nr:hypothetical protein [Agrobacterium tumefaciens]